MYRGPDGADYGRLVYELSRLQQLTYYIGESDESLEPGKLARIEDKLTNADSELSGLVSGLVVEKEQGRVTLITDGAIDLEDWTITTGNPTLVQGVNYFLNGTLMSTTAPTTGYVIKLGHALTERTFLLRIENSVRL